MITLPLYGLGIIMFVCVLFGGLIGIASMLRGR